MTVQQAEALHNKAMEYVDRALSLKLVGKVTEARQFLEIAFNHERSAANAVAGMLDFEPTRSVLLRSAATLAMDLEDLVAAEKLL